MNLSSHSPSHKVIAVATVDDMRERIRRKSKLKGRQADEISLEEVRALIGPRPVEGHRRDLLIEHLHQLNDAYRCLHDRHLVALAKEMNLAMTEVYEVATFYHHFEVVRGDEAAPGLTVRVCDGLACELAGAQDLLARLPALLGGQDVRVIAAPCIGRCEQAPAVVVHQTPVPQATLESVQAAVRASNKPPAHVPRAQAAINFVASDWAEKSLPELQGHVDYATYRAHGGYALAASLASGRADVEPIIHAMEGSNLRGLGGAGREHRRRRAWYLQGQNLSGARPAPLSGGHADCRAGRGH